MNNTNRIWLLMGKKLSSSISPDEEEELETLLFNDPELWYSYEMLQAVMSLDDVPEAFIKEIKLLLEDNQAAPEKLNSLLVVALERTNDEAAETVPELHVSPNRKYWWWASAACISLLTLAGTFILKRIPENGKSLLSSMNEIVAPKGSRTQIMLADGTAIWLNAGSKLVYAKNFSLENREVYLTGEGYFKVVHHENHSFVVHTQEADIRDLGTTFNVKAYEGNPTTETTLIEGSVEVTPKNNPSMKILMRPKEKLVLHHEEKAATDKALPKIRTSQPVFEVSKIVPDAKTNDIIETAWVNNKLIFRDQRFDELAKEMERRYNVTIVITDESIKEYRLTGTFENENVDKAMEYLQFIAYFKFKINNDRILITR